MLNKFKPHSWWLYYDLFENVYKMSIGKSIQIDFNVESFVGCQRIVLHFTIMSANASFPVKRLRQIQKLLY